MFNLFAVAVFWSFMADVFSNVQARAFYGYIGAAGTIGAFLGPTLTSTLVQRVAEALESGLGNPKRPVVAIVGGAILESKEVKDHPGVEALETLH